MSQTRPKSERLSVSLNTELVEWVRYLAKENGRPVSWVVAHAIRALNREERNRRIMAELIADVQEGLTP